MKRFGLTLVAAFCLASVSFAAGNQPTNEKWEGNINVSKLSSYLKLMKKALDEKQYAEYTKVLNVTLKNKGIEVK